MSRASDILRIIRTEPRGWLASDVRAQMAKGQGVKPAEQVMERIEAQAEASASEIASWIDHPDERVMLSLLRNEGHFDLARPIEGRALATRLIRRSEEDADREGVLWTPVLDEMENVEQRCPPEQDQPTNKVHLFSSNRRERMEKVVETLKRCSREEAEELRGPPLSELPGIYGRLARRALPLRGEEEVRQAVGSRHQHLAELADNPHMGPEEAAAALRVSAELVGESSEEEAAGRGPSATDKGRRLNSAYVLVRALLERFPELRGSEEGVPEIGRLIEKEVGARRRPGRHEDEYRRIWYASAIRIQLEPQEGVGEHLGALAREGYLNGPSPMHNVGRGVFLRDAIVHGGLQVARVIELLREHMAEGELLGITREVAREDMRQASELVREVVRLHRERGEARPRGARGVVEQALRGLPRDERSEALTDIRATSSKHESCERDIVEVLESHPELMRGLAVTDLAPALTAPEVETRRIALGLLSRIQAEAQERPPPFPKGRGPVV